MNRISMAIGLLLTVGMAMAQSAETTFYFDFGGRGSRGTATEQPTGNGIHWNNIAPDANDAQSIDAKKNFSLVDSEGNASGYSLTLNNAWGVNSAGGLENPSADLLGDLAVGTVTRDYAFNTNQGDGGRALAIRGLNPEKSYVFTIFGSRSNDGAREYDFYFTGRNSSFGSHKTTGSGTGANGENQNTANIAVTDPITPDAYGNITLYIDNKQSTYCHLNAMVMEEKAGVSHELQGTVAATALLDFGHTTDGSRGAASAEPWNNIGADNGMYAPAGTTFTITPSAGEPFTLTLSNRFSTNGMSGGGGLLSPTEELLGDLAVASATQDYFFTESSETKSAMVFSGLDPKRAYRFSIFGSRKNGEQRTGMFFLQGLNGWGGAHQVAGTAFSGDSQNDRNVMVSEPIFPAADGTITLTVNNGGKTYVALNLMKIEQLTGVVRPDIKTYSSVTLTGNALNEEAGAEGYPLFSRSRSEWEAYARLDAGTLTFRATPEEGDVETVTATVDAPGIYRIGINLDTNDVTFFPVTYLCLTGSTAGGWSTTGIEMTYAGAGAWTFHGELTGADTTSDPGRINFVMNKDWGQTIKRTSRETNSVAFNAGDDIPLNPGNYRITLDLNRMTVSFANGLDQLDPLRVTVMGSSVANGQGATDNKGYAAMLGDLIAPSGMYISNISINGNNSVDLLNRFDDLQREFSKLVIYGISLGNEGIHGAANQQEVYDRWGTNMGTLIERARQDGKEPVVMNNYSRLDFTTADLPWLIDMNSEVARWDVPSIDMLGAIDNGKGQWAEGYEISNDVYHPNTDGHREFFYAIPPTMLAAMAEGKELTMNRTIGNYAPLAQDKGLTIDFESTVHPFTLAFDIKPGTSGAIASLNTATGALLTLTLEGETLRLTGDDVDLSVPATANAAMQVAVTLNYAAKRLGLMVGDESVEAKWTPSADLTSAVIYGAENRQLAETFFYRSSRFYSSPFTSDGKLDKSSLEVYVPTLGENPADGAVANKAMSLNEPTFGDVENGGNGENAIDAPEAASTYSSVTFYSIDGLRVSEAGLVPGVYIVLKDGVASKTLLK